MKKLIFLIILLSVSSLSFANCCICQTDTSPEEHIKWYKTGCRMWLTARGCPTGKVIPFKNGNEGIEKHIPKSCEGKKLKLGYVGHWSSARDTVDYISSILGVLEKKNLSLYYDNTACLAMDNPQTVQDFLNKVSPKLGKRDISIKGNQAISTGMWDPILPGKHNFKAVASTETERVEYPKCSKFVNRGCWAMFQEGETGLCLERDGSKSLLRCTKGVEIEYFVRKKLAGGKVRRRVKKTKKATVWQKVEAKKEDFRMLGGGIDKTYSLTISDNNNEFWSKKEYFLSPEDRAAYLKNIQINLSKVNDDNYKKLKFEEDAREIFDYQIKNGEVKRFSTGNFQYKVSFKDPISDDEVMMVFEDKKEKDAYKEEMKMLKASDQKKKFAKIEHQDETNEKMATIINGDINFTKSFKSEKEAKEYMQKIENSSIKELSDLVYCNYLGKY